LAVIESEIEKVKNAISLVDENIKNLSEDMEEREKRLKAMEEEINSVILSIHKYEMSTAKLEAETEMLTTKLWDEYELSIAGAVKYRIQLNNISEANKRLNQLKTNIKELGDVNVNSIEEYKKVTERHSFLLEQKNDLCAAEETLVQIINEITKKMEIQFVESFRVIREHFNFTFKELFGGGYADLKLEGDDVLNTGIEIIVQPPGKKLQSLSLLSGGERGLAAIALVFAILKMKPTPFCVLDEIEAALDDANVNRFASFLREYSKNTQFIMITHRKGSMAVADALYGVTMEEKGVSKMLSLRLKEDKLA
jgi:chromosome segregation protein